MQCEPGCGGRVGLDALKDCDDKELLEVWGCCNECMTIEERVYCARRIQESVDGRHPGLLGGSREHFE